MRGIDAVHLAGLGQRDDDGPVFGTGVVAGEEGVLAVQGDGRIVRSTGLLSGMLLSAPFEWHTILTWSW